MTFIFMPEGCLITKRYANTKVAEIAAASGIATGTIYNLFTSKKSNTYLCDTGILR